MTYLLISEREWSDRSPVPGDPRGLSAREAVPAGRVATTIKTFSVNKSEAAFRYVQSGANAGMVVTNVEEDDGMPLSHSPDRPGEDEDGALMTVLSLASMLAGDGGSGNRSDNCRNNRRHGKNR